MRFLANHSGLVKAITYLRNKLKTLKQGPNFISELCLATEEIIANIINYNPKLDYFSVSYKVLANNKILVKIIDSGQPFNPLLLLEKTDLGQDLAKRKVGGLGIFLVKNLVNDLQYFYQKDKNINILVKNFLS